MSGSAVARKARRKRERKQTRKSGHGIKGHRLWRFLDLNKAHAVVSGDEEATVVAELRDINIGDFTGLKCWWGATVSYKVVVSEKTSDVAISEGKKKYKMFLRKQRRRWLWKTDDLLGHLRVRHMYPP